MDENIEQTLSHWFAGRLGQLVLSIESLELEKNLATLFGYHIVQLGQFQAANFLDASPIHSQFIISPKPADTDQRIIQANFVELPIKAASVDVVIVPHLLEFAKQPANILAEACRILIPEGRIIIVGFNPISLWGVKRIFTLTVKYQLPWCGNFLAIPKIKAWLRENNCTITTQKSLFFRPPLKQTMLLEKLRFMEVLGPMCWPFCGGINIIVAKKTVIPLTPITASERTRRRWQEAGIAEPSG